MRFLGPNLQIWCTVQPSHQCKMPQEERRKRILSTKMSPAAREISPLNSMTRGSPTQTAVIAMFPSILNSSLCSTKFFLLIMPCLTPTTRGYATNARNVFALPCSPCLFLTLKFPLHVVCRVTFLHQTSLALVPLLTYLLNILCATWDDNQDITKD